MSTGWPLIENDLPPAPDPNYCIDYLKPKAPNKGFRFSFFLA